MQKMSFSFISRIYFEILKAYQVSFRGIYIFKRKN